MRIVEGMDPFGCRGASIEAEHLCMVMRGVKKAGEPIVTSVNRGVLSDATLVLA